MKNAKRNVIVSAILTIALCFSLMIGGTYAWFTDSAKVSVNKIVSGTLKVGLNMWDEENEQWVDANGKTLSFIRTDAEDEDDGLWAPGYKFKLPKLQVVNKGNLRLKYKLEFNGMSDSLLLDVLTFRVKVDGGEEKAVSVGGAILENEILAANEDKEVEIFGEMNENAKNEYQNLEVKNMSITLTATQTNATEYPFKSVSLSSGSLTVSEPVYASGEWGAVKATKSAQITVEADVKAVEKGHGAVAVWASGNSKVIINGGYFSQEITGTDDQYDMIYADDNAVIEINGGKFKCKTPKWTLNCKDGSNAKIIVKGGRFYGFDPSNAETGEGEIEVPNGYHVEKSGNDWFVVYSDDHIGEGYRKVVYGEGEYDYAIVKPLRNYPFKEACRKDNNVVLLASSMSTIDATDKTVTNTADLWDSTPNAWSLVSARETANVTVRGGNFKAKKDDCYAADVYDKTAKLVIKGGNFIGNITAVYVYEGELVIEGGFFDIQQLNSNNVQDGYGVLINCYDANFKNGTAKVTITGGTFVNFNPADNKAEGAGTNFVPEGYKVVSETKANGDVWYTVVKA